MILVNASFLICTWTLFRFQVSRPVSRVDPLRIHSFHPLPSSFSLHLRIIYVAHTVVYNQSCTTAKEDSENA